MRLPKSVTQVRGFTHNKQPFQVWFKDDDNDDDEDDDYDDDDEDEYDDDDYDC